MTESANGGQRVVNKRSVLPVWSCGFARSNALCLDDCLKAWSIVYEVTHDTLPDLVVWLRRDIEIGVIEKIAVIQRVEHTR
jgi:hypothetical protein